MTTDQPPKRVLWIATQETPEQLKPHLTPFGDRWEIEVMPKSKNLIISLLSAQVGLIPKPDLLIWGGDIVELEREFSHNVGLVEFLKRIRDIYPDYKLNILPFYPENREKDNSQILGFIPELKRVGSNVQIIGELGDHPRQAIQSPEKMVELEIALGLREGMSVEGQAVPASTTDPARK